MGSFDSAPNSILAFNILERHTLDLDAFRGSYFTGLGGQYAFVEAPNGHLTSVFPIGTAILTFPAYAVVYAVAGPPPITSASFEPARRSYEKVLAALIAALCVVLFLLCAELIGTTMQAAIATAVFALATSMWTIGSQALWQHGPVNLFVLAMTFALLRAERARTPWGLLLWLLAAGACGGFLPVIRPTALLFSFAGLAFALWTLRARAWPFVLSFAVAIAPGLAWNMYFFHAFAGGYRVNTEAFSAAPLAALVAFGGLLISPSRGLFVFSPVLLYSLWGFAAAARSRAQSSRLFVMLGVAGLALILMYSFFAYWWAGFAYGPRFLTDLAAIGALLLVFIIPKNPLANRFALCAFVVLFTFSVAVQIAGANSGAAGADWNAIPVSVDRMPTRLWQLADSQIQRNALGMYYKNVAWNITLQPDYLHELGGEVSSLVLPGVAKAGASLEVTASVRNTGRSRQYGYDSGVYVGQLRVPVRIVDARSQLQSERYLFLRGSPVTGQSAQAVGTIQVPSQPGDYRVETGLLALGLGRVPERGATASHLLKVTP